MPSTYFVLSVVFFLDMGVCTAGKELSFCKSQVFTCAKIGMTDLNNVPYLKRLVHQFQTMLTVIV